ncbi:MAG: error-prone polymerase [Caulobacteraceae bacterium]|nr:error-prone polymerase [Caulobacteraceae bacterium]
MSAYAELQVTSNFSFLRGASHAHELVGMAEALGLKALGVTDRNSLAGVVRPWTECKARKYRLRSLTGCRLDFADGSPSLLVYPSDREAYGRLTRLLTLGQRRGRKAQCHLAWADFENEAQGQLALVLPSERLDETFETRLKALTGLLSGRLWIAASRAFGARDLQRLHRLDELGRRYGAPMVATGDVLYHAADRRPLADVMAAIRENCTVQEAGFRLNANAERHLKSAAEMGRLFKAWPEAVERSLEVEGRIRFDLSDLKYEYPDEPVPPGKTAIQHLRDLAWKGADWRYRGSIPDKVRRLLESELALIEELDYANYFLTVHDIVQWARDPERNILCQGRGSAANSAVCYCLGVTPADPFRHSLLFARFLSRERSEPPDIDVDFEHNRREEVMQYVFDRYGRDRAAICATVIHYRPRMAIRQVGKALGLSEDVAALLAKTVWGSWGGDMPKSQVEEAGFDPDNPEIRRAVVLAEQLIGFPRHLSQHVGGFILTKRRLDETVPIGNAAMKDRTFIEWDKDDIDALNLMKVDILALGMLTALKGGLNMLEADHGVKIDDLDDIIQDVQPGVYEMLSKADSVGVFQVESRAQMSMLPRLKPKEFYDLVIEVAFVRPGPIQGNMVHPYLKRRESTEPIVFPCPSPKHGPADELEGVLRKTLGVPLFQEQAMQLAIDAAKFTPEEANGLRRSMATFRAYGHVGDYGAKFIGGMVDRGYDQTFAENCFKQIEGFGSYGFPESHAISFALLVYASAWLKWRWPDVFCAALLNAQPMGFYQPAQLVRDARAHDVEVRVIDILHSDWDCTLEKPANWRHGQVQSVRLGFREIDGFRKEEALALMAARSQGARSLVDLAKAAHLSRRALEKLAEADALRSLGLDRRAGLWAVKGLGAEVVAAPAPLLANLDLFEEPTHLPAMPLAAHVAEDYRMVGLSLKKHPCHFFRPDLARLGASPAADLAAMGDGAKIGVGGLVLMRQRPGTAKGTVFLTLEDETGGANIIVWAKPFAANRRLVMTASLMVVYGRLQTANGVTHIIAERFVDLTSRLTRLKREEDDIILANEPVRGAMVRSRDFH